MKNFLSRCWAMLKKHFFNFFRVLTLAACVAGVVFLYFQKLDPAPIQQEVIASIDHCSFTCAMTFLQAGKAREMLESGMEPSMIRGFIIGNCLSMCVSDLERDTSTFIKQYKKTPKEMEGMEVDK
jgi:hypothetical protein